MCVVQSNLNMNSIPNVAAVAAHSTNQVGSARLEVVLAVLIFFLLLLLGSVWKVLINDEPQGAAKSNQPPRQSHSKRKTRIETPCTNAKVHYVAATGRKYSQLQVHDRFGLELEFFCPNSLFGVVWMERTHRQGVTFLTSAKAITLNTYTRTYMQQTLPLRMYLFKTPLCEIDRIWIGKEWGHLRN